MVHELAEYERAPEQCHLTEEQLHAALFGTNPAVFVHVAELSPDEVSELPHAGSVVGFALWFLNFSTWEGVHGIYLEDLYVRPSARGTGAGRALLTTLAEICVERGYARLEWWVLDWNIDAIGFYEYIGAEPMDEWTVYRLSGEPLRALGGRAAGAGSKPVDVPGERA
jgi:GNAT superfamily N-acetyltransferase